MDGAPVLMKTVKPKINKTDVQAQSVKRKVHIESASSKIAFSPCPPIAPDTMDNMLNESLFKNKFMITGKVMTAIAIMAITPQELFIDAMLELKVRRASFTDEPTKGTKLLMANLAVFIDSESALWLSTPLYDKTKRKTDITNTVTEVKVVRTIFVIPLRSQAWFADLTEENARQTLTTGSISFNKNSSTKLINNSIEPFVTTALDKFPLSVKTVTITGKKAFVT